MIRDTYVKGTKESEAGHLYPSNGGGASVVHAARAAASARLTLNPETFDGFDGLNPET